MSETIRTGQIWQSRRKGGEDRRLMVTGAPERSDDMRAYVRVIYKKKVSGRILRGELTVRTLRKNYWLLYDMS